MGTKTKKYSTISFDIDLQERLQSICDEHQLSKTQFVEHSIEFFARTGINPKDHLDDTRTQIKELRSTFISFIREQEKKIENNFIKLQQGQPMRTAEPTPDILTNALIEKMGSILDGQQAIMGMLGHTFDLVEVKVKKNAPR